MRKLRPAIGLTIILLAVAAGLSSFGAAGQAAAAADHASDDSLALTPPMGWYPWNAFGEEPQNEQLIRQIVDALVGSGMREAGYAYVGPDEGKCFTRGPDGRLAPNLERYPSGLRGLGDWIHARGLKYALYTDAGTKTCSGAMPGTNGHEIADMASFADWRADYVKIDWCNSEGQDIVRSYTALHDAQHAAGRPIVHSLCSWGDGSPWLWAAPVGHLWRTTTDVCAPGQADWDLAVRIVMANERLSAYAGPGHWNDPDMLIVGMPGLTAVQNRSVFSLWCMMAAPLMAGNDLRGMTAETISTLTNLEAIAVDQDPRGVQGRVVWSDGQFSLWGAKPLFDGSVAALVFSQTRRAHDVTISWKDLGIDPAAPRYVRDLWAHTTSGPVAGSFTVRVEPGGVAFLRIAEKNAFPIPPVLSADTYRVALTAPAGSAAPLKGTVTVRNNGSGDLPPWRVRTGDLPSWLSVTVTGSGRAQTFTNAASTAGLKPGSYHAVVRADNVEPVSGRPMSALYYDVDLDVAAEKTR